VTERPAYRDLPDGCAWDLLDPDLGSLALLTPDRVRDAARLVRRGVRFPLDLPLSLPDPPFFGRESMRHEVFNLAEYVLDDLEGYRGSTPVRIGNAAAEQVQLDIYGELIQTTYTAWQSRKQLPRPRRAIVLSVVDYILEHWQMEDAGIWESRRRPRRYLYSQVMLWVGLDRALRLDPALRMGKVRRAAVKRTRDTIKRQVLELGYDQELGVFTQALGHKELDATALAVAMYEMLPPTDPRVVSTVKVLQEKLSNKGFLYRYVPEESEFRQPEGVFIICTLWLVNVLAQMGRRNEA